MIGYEKDGVKFQEQLTHYFNQAWYSEKTKTCTDYFDDLTVEDNIIRWENFHSELMVSLRWALVFSDVYMTPTSNYDVCTFNIFEEKKIYKAYPFGRDLPIKLLYVKVKEDTVFLYAQDTLTQDMAYGLLDLVNKKITTGFGPHHLKEVFGSYQSTNIINHLAI